MDNHSPIGATKVFDRHRVNLVDEQDKIIASADKFEAHLGEGKLHQAVSLFLFKKNSLGQLELLMQKRAAKKIVGAGEWANTLCGNVAVGESHRQCVLRRLEEELGLILPAALTNRMQDFFTFNYAVPCNEQYSECELDHFFSLILSSEEAEQLNINLNPQEVSQISWQDWSNLVQRQLNNPLDFTPWFKLFLEDERSFQAIIQQLRKA